MNHGHGGHGHSFQDEEVLGKAYDVRLVRRLLRYAKPYTRLAATCILILLGITVLQLRVPDITRRAIDNYVVATGRLIRFPGNPTQFETGFVRKYGRSLTPFGGRTYLVREPALKSFDPKDQAALRALKVLGETKYTVADASECSLKELEQVEQIAAKHPGLFQRVGDTFIVEYEKTGLIAREDISVLKRNDLRGVMRLVGLLFCVLVGIFLLSSSRGYLLERLGQRTMHDIRIHIFSCLQKLSLSFFDNNPVGRLVTRVTNDIQALSEAFTGVMVNVFSDFFVLAGAAICIFTLNWRLSLVSLCVIPPIVCTTILFRRKVRPAFREVRVKIARVNAALQENISGMRVVQIFRREEENFKRFREINHENYVANFRQIIVFAVFRPLIDMFSSASIALIVWYGGGQVLQDKLTLGELVAFFTYVSMFFRPIHDLAERYNILQGAMASAERIFLLLDTPVEVKEPEQPLVARGEPKPLPAIAGHIEFRDVWFAYDGDRHVLKGVSFKVAPGEKIAIVGPTGSGKTTIINLLSRFYDVKKGAILIDNVDIRELDTRFLRSNIGVVMQDVFIFSGDIKSNIRLGARGVTDAAIVRAAQYARADSFIERLPRKYDEEVKERGATFSTGERQLLSFARALAFDPKILVLDEATANTDTQTEALIQEGLLNLMRSRTALIIAHRLSTIKHVDRILVMHSGQIVEDGTHEELLAKGGLYRKLYLLQYQTAPALRTAAA